MSIPVTPLGALAPLRISGPDARSFLQGQLSQDLRKLSAQRALLASCNSHRGRVQAVLTLVAHGEGIVALVPAPMAERIVRRLLPFVLRARVWIERDEGLVVGSVAAAVAGPLPTLPGGTLPQGDCTVLRGWGPEARYLLLGPREAVSLQEAPLAELAWHRADIAAGLPRVLEPTAEVFIAQMLNLDLLEAISFDKGCYTGQEIIVRMHHRSTVKRRMFRFQAAGPAPAPGAGVLAGEERVGDVVDAVDTPQGCELLAVITLAHPAVPLQLEGRLDAPLRLLPLPYAIPEAQWAPLGQASRQPAQWGHQPAGLSRPGGRSDACSG